MIDARRRKVFKLIGAALAAPFAAVAAAREPKAVTVYMVRTELKCTFDQTEALIEILQKKGKEWGKKPGDWKITAKRYGAWEE